MFETLEDLSPFKPHLNCSDFFHGASCRLLPVLFLCSFCSFSSLGTQMFTRRQNCMCVDLKAMLWTDSSLGSTCDWAHVCENVSYVSAAWRFYQWRVRSWILITQFDIQMSEDTSHGFTHLHLHHVRLKAQSVSISLDGKMREYDLKSQCCFILNKSNKLYSFEKTKLKNSSLT